MVAQSQVSQMSKISSPFCRIFHLLILLLFILLPLQVNSQLVNKTEQKILLEMKQQRRNPPSLVLWNSSSPSAPCDWLGIQCDFVSVTNIFLNDRNINGAIPPTICQLENLRSIDLSNHHITGNIPQTLFSHCLMLKSIDSSTNSLTGQIPGELFHLRRLERLALYKNMLDGELPSSIEALSLSSILLADNKLSGPIPEEFGNLSNLIQLDLSWNYLTCLIPAKLFLSHQLNFLYLHHNSLSGHIPTPIETVNMIEINLSNNHLTGLVPADLGNLYRLKSLGLSNNKLSGHIWEIVSLLRQPISTLQLCSNKISGKVSYNFVTLKFKKFCQDDSNLCSDDKSMGYSSCQSKNHMSKYHLIIIIFCAIGSGVIGLLKWKRNQESNVVDEWEMIRFKRFDFTKWDILSNLTDNNVIGKGGSGKVYRLAISQTGKNVAVKNICSEKKSEHRLEKEFLAEVEILGLIRHSNIVKLLCCIFSKNTKLLVYEYLKNQSLDIWLHKRESLSVEHSSIQLVVLDWPKRLQIAIGAAKRLCYMHHDCAPPVLHRDVKSSNILLDSEFNGKIADFGLAKLLTKRGQPETASAIAGTFGYIAPEYASIMKVNVKSDIYGFGVVLLELTTGRAAVTRDEHINLAEWAHRHSDKGKSIVDALDNEIKEACYLETITAVFKLGLKCTAKSPFTRPSMKKVQQILQYCVTNFPSQG